jgi:hypothetical protein
MYMRGEKYKVIINDQPLTGYESGRKITPFHVISPLHFFDREEEFLLGDSMDLHQPFLSKGPESFNPVDADASLFEIVPVNNVQMLISTE